MYLRLEMARVKPLSFAPYRRFVLYYHQKVWDLENPDQCRPSRPVRTPKKKKSDERVF